MSMYSDGEGSSRGKKTKGGIKVLFNVTKSPTEYSPNAPLSQQWRKRLAEKLSAVNGTVERQGDLVYRHEWQG